MVTEVANGTGQAEAEASAVCNRIEVPDIQLLGLTD